LKATPLVGNLVVSLVVATALVYGGLSMGSVEPALTAAVFAFLTTLARELLKDIQDLAGDSAHSVSSLAVIMGPQAAARMAIVILAATIGLTVLPFLFLGYSGMYLMLMMAADGMILGAVWKAAGPKPTESAGAASRWTKMAMVFGLAALALANATGS
jgi:geranylgeranylglycerol-phosphate geranylgeranyltransferase